MKRLRGILSQNLDYIRNQIDITGRLSEPAPVMTAVVRVAIHQHSSALIEDIAPSIYKISASVFVRVPSAHLVDKVLTLSRFSLRTAAEAIEKLRRKKHNILDELSLRQPAVAA